MADRLSKVYGTQMDKVNCPFFYKIGACRYGDSCQRIHNKPPISETVMLQHIYENNPIQTALISGNNVSSADAEKAINKYQMFYEQVFKQMSQFGEIQDMIVVDNLGDHIAGNAYVKYTQEQYAQNAFRHINGRYMNDRKVDAQFSPVTDFQNAKCKQYMDGSCKRGGYCNYMHIKPLSKSFKKQLFTQMYLQHPEYRQRKRVESDSDSWQLPRQKRHKDRRHHDKHGGHDDRDKKKHRSKERSRSRDKHRRKQKKRRRQSQQRDRERNSQQRRDMIAQWNDDNY